MTRGIEIASGKGRALAAPNVINASNLAHHFSVKLSLFMRSHSSYLLRLAQARPHNVLHFLVD